MRLIDADALLARVDKEREYLLANKMLGAEHILVHHCLRLIDDAPTVPLPDFKEGCKQAILDGKTNFSRPQGEWIYTDKNDKKKGFGGYCSVCKCDMPIGMNDWKQEYYESKYCPNCGADMRKGGAK